MVAMTLNPFKVFQGYLPYFVGLIFILKIYGSLEWTLMITPKVEGFSIQQSNLAAIWATIGVSIFFLLVTVAGVYLGYQQQQGLVLLY